MDLERVSFDRSAGDTDGSILARGRRPRSGRVGERQRAQTSPHPRFARTLPRGEGWRCRCRECSSQRSRPDLMEKLRLRAALAALLIALVTALIAASPALDLLHGRSIDVLTALRWQVFGDAHAPAPSPTVAVVARRGNLPHAAVRGHAHRHLDPRDRPGADRDRRRRRQGRRLRHRVPDLDRAVGHAVRRRDARRAGARLRPRLPARAGDRRARRQGGARPGAASATSRCCRRPASAPRSASGATSARSMSIPIRTT